MKEIHGRLLYDITGMCYLCGYCNGKLKRIKDDKWDYKCMECKARFELIIKDMRI